MHISHLVFRRDDVHGNAHDLGVRQIHRQRTAQLVQPLFCDGVLMRVEMLYIIGKRHLNVKSFAAALDGKVEMVGQGIGQVCIQGAIQFFSAISSAARNTASGTSRRSAKYFSFTS